MTIDIDIKCSHFVLSELSRLARKARRWRVHTVFAFDTLSYARFLRERGVSQDHAEAARQFIMAELVTKQDLLAVRQDLQAVRQDLQKDLQNAVTHFDAKLDNLSLRLTVRLGVLLAAGVGALAALVKLT
jgi:hypothetical protein